MTLANAHRTYEADGSESFLPDPDLVGALTDEQKTVNRLGIAGVRAAILASRAPEAPTPPAVAAQQLELPITSGPSLPTPPAKLA